ncbi:MFS transporter [Ruoffia tabacinasalis]|uniref:MFS transporter n=1 Tax=Ruoffia tabacinasalis TaxID=87458 RepID=UPI003F9AF16A
MRQKNASEETASERRSFKKWMMLPLVICIYLGVFQKITGANALLFYVPTILEQSAVPTEYSYLSTIGIGVIILIGTLVCHQIAGQAGRKALLLGGNAVMGLALFFGY